MRKGGGRDREAVEVEVEVEWGRGERGAHSCHLIQLGEKS